MRPANAATPVALVVLAAGAAAYAYLVDRGTVSDVERAARRSDVFPSFRVDDVTRIELEHGAESLVLERGGDAAGGALWSMTSPRGERADAAAVDVLLRDLEMARRLRDVDPKDAPGLDAPRVRGRVRVGALEYRFVLGDDAPVPDGAAYMRVDGEGTFVVDRVLKVQLLRGADAYRDRTLVPYGASAIARLEVRAASGEAVALERQGGTFRVGGTGLRASRDAVDRLMMALADARAESFLDDAAADREVAAPAFRVTVDPRDASGRVELLVGGACPAEEGGVVVVRRAPARRSACAPKLLRDALRAVAAGAPVDASPFFAHADEMEELRLEPVGREGPRVDVARRGSGWRVRAPEERDLAGDEGDSVSALALSLAQARGAEPHKATGEDRFEARARVTVVRTGGGATEVVEVGAAAADGSVMVRRADDGAVVRLPRATARRFVPHPVALRGRSPWRAPFDAAAVVAIDDTCTPAPHRLELHDRAWTMRAPVGQAVDAPWLVDLTGALARANADAWIAEADDGAFGFADPGACDVTLTLDAAAADGGPRRVAIAFGAAGDGGFYARAQDDAAVFVAPASLRAMLGHPALDRSRLRVDLAPDAMVTLSHGIERRTLGPAIADGDRLAGAVSSLHAQCALHAGAAGRDEGFDRPTLEIAAASPGEGGTPLETRIVIGARTQVDGAEAYFARVSGVDATFAVPGSAVAAILSSF
jgi:hypothetical protein